MAEIHPNDIGLATYADVGNVERLRTTAKTVVEAINEIYQTGGGGSSVDGDQIYVDGENNVIVGKGNIVYGNNNLVIGSNNTVVGNNINLFGNNKTIYKNPYNGFYVNWFDTDGKIYYDCFDEEGESCPPPFEIGDKVSKEYPIEKLKEISDKIIEIQTAVMKLHRKKQQGKIDSDAYNRKIEELQQELQENESKQLQLQQVTTKVSHIKDWMKEFGKHMETTQMDGKYDRAVIKKLVNKIKMYDDRIVVEFNYGIKVEQEYVE